jgi:nucleoside-diphosphate-sugar epimerase
MIASKLNWKGLVNWNTKPKRDGEIYVLNSTHAKAERLLGWSPKVNLNDGLDMAIDLWKHKRII